MKTLTSLLSVLLMLLVFPSSVKAQSSSAGTLKPGDSVNISLQNPIADTASVTMIYPVSNRGTVKMPYLDQEIPAAGITAEALARRIEAAYRAADIYTNPSLTAVINGETTGPSHVVNVGGEVKVPGEFQLRQGMTLLAAINKCGGFTEFSNPKKVKLLRGNTERIYDMRKVLPDGSNNPVLQDGDQITVPGG